MLSFGRRFSPFAGISLIAGVAAIAHGADPLAAPSPFLPPSNAAEAAPTQDAQLELRGVMSNGDVTMFSIYDAARHSSVWTRLNESGRDFVVRSYDPARDVVTVDYQGRTLTLALRSAKVVSAPVTLPQGPAVTTPPPPGAPQPIGGPVVLNPTPADEQRRLEAIAAEVNRRRMIRQQALQAQRQTAQQSGAAAPGANQPR